MKTTNATRKNRAARNNTHAVESLSWDSAGSPVWTLESEQPSHDKAKAAMDKLHKERKNVSLRIRHTGQTTARVTTSADVGKLRRADAETNATTASEGRSAAGKKAAPVQRAAPAKKAAPVKKAKAPKAGANGKMSALDAAAKVLNEASKPMNTKEMIETMAAKGYWSSPNGLTPWATLYSAITRELNFKGNDARFVKADRGKFVARDAAG